MENVEELEMQKHERVVDYFLEKGTISASRIQAEYCIGYPKANNIVEQLIKLGVVKRDKETWISTIIKKDKDLIVKVLNDNLSVSKEKK